MSIFEKVFGRQPMARAGEKKSPGGVTSSGQSVAEGTLVFTDGLGAETKAPQGEAVPKPAEPKVAVVPEPIKLEEKKETPLKRGDVLGNSRGERMIVERVEKKEEAGENRKTVVFSEESAPGIRKNRGSFSYKAPENFEVVAGMGKMQKIGRKKDPKYEERIEKIIEVFNRKYNIAGEQIEKWSETLVADDDTALYEKLFERYAEIGNKWNELGDNVAEQGEQRIQLLDELRLLEEELFAKGIIKQSEKNGNGEVQRTRKGKQKPRFVRGAEDKGGSGKSVAAGGAKTTRERKRADAMGEPTIQSTKAGKAEEKNQLAVEQAPASGAAQGEQEVTMSEEEIEEAVEGFGWLLEDRARPIYAKIEKLSSDSLPEESDQLYRLEGEGKIFLPKDATNGLLEAYNELPDKAKVAAEEKWLGINYDLESKLLGRKFLIALETVKQTWEDKIKNAATFRELKSIGSEQRNGRDEQKRRLRVFIPTDPRDRSEAFAPLLTVIDEMIKQRRRAPAESNLPGFSKLFSSEVLPIIKKTNQEIFSSWKSKQRELPGGNGERKGRRGRTIEGEVSSFELTVPEEQQKRILGEMQGFIIKGLEYIDAGLRKAEQRGLDDFLRSTDPKDRQRILLLLQKGIGENVVKIGQAHGTGMKAGTAQRVALAIEEKGKALLFDAMKQRLLPDKTKQE